MVETGNNDMSHRHEKKVKCRCLWDRHFECMFRLDRFVNENNLIALNKMKVSFKMVSK